MRSPARSWTVEDVKLKVRRRTRSRPQLQGGGESSRRDDATATSDLAAPTYRSSEDRHCPAATGVLSAKLPAGQEASIPGVLTNSGTSSGGGSVGRTIDLSGVLRAG